jgi:hypothetical protein
MAARNYGTTARERLRSKFFEGDEIQALEFP